VGIPRVTRPATHREAPALIAIGVLKIKAKVGELMPAKSRRGREAGRLLRGRPGPGARARRWRTCNRDAFTPPDATVCWPADNSAGEQPCNRSTRRLRPVDVPGPEGGRRFGPCCCHP